MTRYYNDVHLSRLEWHDKHLPKTEIAFAGHVVDELAAQQLFLAVRKKNFEIFSSAQVTLQVEKKTKIRK